MTSDVCVRILQRVFFLSKWCKKVIQRGRCILFWIEAGDELEKNNYLVSIKITPELTHSTWANMHRGCGCRQIKKWRLLLQLTIFQLICCFFLLSFFCFVCLIINFLSKHWLHVSASVVLLLRSVGYYRCNRVRVWVNYSIIKGY